MKRKISVEDALGQIAAREGVPVEEVREQIRIAMLEGMRSPDPAIQAEWKRIPCKGSVPTPEETIEYLASQLDLGTEPYGQ